MASSQIKACVICMGSLNGEARFTGGCSHSFHFHCISPTLSSGDPVCPVCHAPFAARAPPPTFVFNPRCVFNSPYVFPPTDQPFSPAFPPEPPHFSDDDPLITVPSDPMSCGPRVGLERLAITGVPERPAIAAAEAVSLFTVLVGIKGSALSDACATDSRAPIDLVTVLDVSYSMMGSKLALVKRAVHFVIDNLGPSDRLSIVTFASRARRILRLRRMSESGRVEAKRAVASLMVFGGTNIVEGLRKGVQVLEERRQANPVSSIIFLSDGNDNCHPPSFSWPTSDSVPSLGYLHLLPVSICPRNNPSICNAGPMRTIPVHSFGFGSDHDPIAMHAISDASGGTFSFIESYEVVQDAFAGCIGGLLSVVAQEVRLLLRSASHGVEIKSIASGRYPNEIDNGSLGTIDVGNVYADEHKEFLINVSVPALPNEEMDAKTSLLDITCSYKDIGSKEMASMEGELVDIRRPKTPSLTDMMVNLAIDRQRNRVLAAEAIAEAQRMAEVGDLAGARTLLAKRRGDVLASAAGQAGDGLCMWLQADMKETETRMENQQVYQQAGRAYALAGMSSHGFQRATMRGSTVAGVDSFAFDGANVTAQSAAFGGYATPCVANMVFQSQQQRKDEGSSKKG